LGPDAANAAAGNFQAAMNSTRIGLTDRIGIQSTNDSQSIGRDDNSSSICVSNRDFQDLCGILSVGSRVTILR
jgi:hypothetical protein